MHLLTRAYLRWFATPIQVEDSTTTTDVGLDTPSLSVTASADSRNTTQTPAKTSTGSVQTPAAASKSDDSSATTASSLESAVCQRENLVAVVEQFRMHMRRNALIFRMNRREQRNYHALIDKIGMSK